MMQTHTLESIAARFGVFVEELRDFFQSRQQRFGTPADVLPLVQRLRAEPAFAEEMESMTRSILYSVNEPFRRGELLGLVLVAIGGAGEGERSDAEELARHQLAEFLEGVVRQPWGGNSGTDGEAGEADSEAVAAPSPDPLTAGDILSTEPPAPRSAPEAYVPPLRSPAPRPRYEEAERRGATRTRPAFPEEEFPSAPSPSLQPRASRVAGPAPVESSEMLYRAVTMAEAEGLAPAVPPVPRRPRRSLEAWWSIPAVVLVLLLIAAGIYFGAPAWRHQGTASPALNLSRLTPGHAPTQSCIALPGPGVTRSGLEERARWAHSLLEQKLYDAALPELRSIAQLDPGFPGIQLDRSEALLNLKRPDEARQAIDEQIAVASCLSKLPAPALDAYCDAQYGAAATVACRPQLAHIRQAAELQAALVHLELSHRVNSDGGTAAALAALKQTEQAAPAVPDASRAPSRVAPAPSPQGRTVPLPPASESDSEQPSLPRAAGGDRGHGQDAQPSRGDGTTVPPDTAPQF